MDPVGSGWPYAYNRLISQGTGTGNFGASGSVTATPLIVQPTATVATGVNPYGGATTFLAPPTYDVFSTLFHPHAAAAAAAAQANSQAANLKSLSSFNAPVEISNSASSSPLSLSVVQQVQQHQQQHQQQQQQQQTQQQSQQAQHYNNNYENLSSSRNAPNIVTWGGGGGAGQAVQQSQSQSQQLQFGLIPSAGNNNHNNSNSSPLSSSASSSLATITRVNSNGCGAGSGGGGESTMTPATTTAMYENYNAQLKAHSLYQLNSHLANAAVMAMANKLNANRTMSLQQVAMSPNNSSSSSNANSNYIGANDRHKVQQEYVHQSSPSPSIVKHPSSSVSSLSNPSSSSSAAAAAAAAIPLIQFEAARAMQAKTAAAAAAAAAASSIPQQSSPISYSMWNNNSPVQNKFSCDVVQQQQQQQQQQNLRKPMQTPSPVGSAFTRQPQQQQSIVSHQQQSMQDSIYINHRVKSNSSTESGQYSNHSTNDTPPAPQTNRQNSSSAASVVVVPRRPSPMQMQSQASPLGHAPSPGYPMYSSPMNMTSNQSQTNQQQSQYGGNSCSGTTSNSNQSTVSSSPSASVQSSDRVIHEERVGRGGGGHHTNLNQNNQQQQSQGRDQSTAYSSVITRVAGTTPSSPWHGGGAEASGERVTGTTGQGQQQRQSNEINLTRAEDRRISSVASVTNNQKSSTKKRKPTREELLEECTRINKQQQQQQRIQQPQSNVQQNVWQHPGMNVNQQQQQQQQQLVKQSYESPNSAVSSPGGGSMRTGSNSALVGGTGTIGSHQNQPQNHQQNHPNSHQSAFNSVPHRSYNNSLGEDSRDEEMDRRRAEVARSQVVVPDIMEELNFLSSAATAAAATAKKGTAIREERGIGSNNIKSTSNSIIKGSPENGRVKIISVEATQKWPEKKAATKDGKDEEKGFIGSYLKFLQGDHNPLPIFGASPVARKRTPAQQKKEVNENLNITGGVGGNKRKNVSNGERNDQQPIQEQQQPVAPVKRGRNAASEVDDQGYVPNGTGVYDATYLQQQALPQQQLGQQVLQQQQQQLSQSQYAAPQYLGHPSLGIPGGHHHHSHFQSHMAAAAAASAVGTIAPAHGAPAAVPSSQMLPQSYGAAAPTQQPPASEEGFNYFDFPFRSRW